MSRPTPPGEDPFALEAQQLEADRRVADAERASAALQRRAEAAEARVEEARERVLQERASREEALSEVTALLDAERRRGTALTESLQDQLTEVKARLGEAERSLGAERDERSAAEASFTTVAHARLAAALGERDRVEDELSAGLEELRRTLAAAEAETASARSDRAALEEEHAQLGHALVAEQAAVREATARVEAAARAAREQADHGRAGVEALQQRLAEELTRREQLLLALRDAEQRASGTEEIRAHLELRQRELASLQARAHGASDVAARLQDQLAALQRQVVEGRDELQAERVARGTAETLLAQARQDHAVEISTAKAVLERVRVGHAAELAHTEGQLQVALEAERSAFARERSDLESRVQRAVAEAEASLAGERVARQHERDEIAGSLTSLRTDIESTIAALREKLEAELTHTRALIGTLEERNETLTTENRTLAEARADVEHALESSEARAATLDEELTHRRGLMDRVGAATDELRDRLAETRAALSSETARRASTELAAREVMAAAQNVLRARADEQAPAADAADPFEAGESAVARPPEDAPRETTASPPAVAAPEPIPDLGDAAAHVEAAAAPASPARKLSDVLPGPVPVEPAPERPPPPAPPGSPAAAPAVVVGDPPAEGVEDLSQRFDRIRAQLAERGIRSARVPGPRRPGGPR